MRTSCSKMVVTPRTLSWQIDRQHKESEAKRSCLMAQIEGDIWCLPSLVYMRNSAKLKKFKYFIKSFKRIMSSLSSFHIWSYFFSRQLHYTALLCKRKVYIISINNNGTDTYWHIYMRYIKRHIFIFLLWNLKKKSKQKLKKNRSSFLSFLIKSNAFFCFPFNGCRQVELIASLDRLFAGFWV